jgi:Right handed beta helix region
MRRTAILCALAAGALAFAASNGAASGPATLVVDRDGVECANADFTSIQAAVDAAEPGDLIRVCPDLYAESVVVDKPVTVKADPDAVGAIDCLQPTLGELPLDQQAIVDPADDGFSIAFKLAADDVVLEGFVVQGASVGIDTSDRFSGYRVHHNLIRLNRLFGMDFGSEGTRQSRVDHNCFRDGLLTNSWGLVSELDDDSLWKPSDGPERDEWNVRHLRDARIDHNQTFRNRAGLEAAGPGRPVRVTFEHNLSVGDTIGIAIQNSEQSRIIDNDLRPARNGLVAGGANSGLEVSRNRIEGGTQALVFTRLGFIDVFPTPSTLTVAAENLVTGASLDGILVSTDGLRDSYLLDNVLTDHGRDGVRIFLGSNGNAIRNNASDRNGRYGIFAQGATANLFEANSMLGNGVFDARDDNRAANTWIANQCVNDFPAGTICGVG